MTSPQSLPGKTLVGVRFVLGSSAWLAPKFFVLGTGLDPHANPHAAYMARLFGIRDLALGIGLLSTRGNARRLWWRLGIMCDLGDMVSGALSARAGQIPSHPAALRPLLTAAGAAGAGLGAAALISGDV